MTNIIFFPGNTPPAFGGDRSDAKRPVYEFTQAELAGLYRWYSAMRYAFPSLQGVLSVCHARHFAAIGLYGSGSTTLSCILSKHADRQGAYFLWSTDQDAPRRLQRLEEITEAQIGAISPPPDEANWLDLMGWTAIVANPLTASPIGVV
jgi:hypothetical protein